ncbi:MAG TPA: hypothetical protein VJW20_13300 [Candidatus Angelobacter sp.]|nr:hypothetical protein [Candidatus Angelobacter sp.]
MRCIWASLIVLFCTVMLCGQEHSHPEPEKLGAVSFPTTCVPGVKAQFNRAVALLHSFTYAPAETAFRDVLRDDPACVMAHWGIAMSYYHQLWEPALPGDSAEKGRAELASAIQSGGGSAREKEYLAAAAFIFDDSTAPVPERARKYRDAMHAIAQQHPDDMEAQIFYALALLGTALPTDKSHENQKKAAEILESLYLKHPQHPGLAHYLIHAYDNAELATRGVKAARDYGQIAPSAPHALHMPSHIFTRLGMWDDSIRANQSARIAARKLGDTGEELHAMDYLVYAALQKGRDGDAAAILSALNAMGLRQEREFKSAYAATAMQVRYAVERKQWQAAQQCQATEGAPPHVLALAAWARALGHARSGDPAGAQSDLMMLLKLVDQLHDAGNAYWAGQVKIQYEEASAWMAWAQKKPKEAVTYMSNAANEEDAVEKLPVTPGPVVPAREQLAELLALDGHPADALAEYEKSLKDSPARRNALQGALETSKAAGLQAKVEFYQAQLK